MAKFPESVFEGCSVDHDRDECMEFVPEEWAESEFWGSVSKVLIESFYVCRECGYVREG